MATVHVCMQLSSVTWCVSSHCEDFVLPLTSLHQCWCGQYMMQCKTQVKQRAKVWYVKQMSGSAGGRFETAAGTLGTCFSTMLFASALWLTSKWTPRWTADCSWLGFSRNGIRFAMSKVMMSTSSEVHACHIHHCVHQEQGLSADVRLVGTKWLLFLTRQAQCLRGWRQTKMVVRKLGISVLVQECLNIRTLFL